MLRSSVLVVAAAFACSSLVACGPSDADARPQLVVVVDTDLPTLGLVADDESLALDAAVDTLRIDVVGPRGEVTDFLDVVAPDPRDWPVSFGVPSDFVPGRKIRLRLRLFRSRLAESGENRGRTTLEPASGVTVDRGLDLELPAQGVRAVLVRLTGDCWANVPDFAAGTTCVDGARPSTGFGDGATVIERFPLPESHVGTWNRARAKQCSTGASGDRVCIPGGFTLLGDQELVGFADGIQYHLDPVPLRPVAVSPFFLDRTEYTVARLRALLARPGAPSQIWPELRDPTSRNFQYCSFLGPDDPANDRLPVNCITRAQALEICRAEGGTLPSEAQWEHAARGHGSGRGYPWGEQPPSCCTAGLARDGVTCPGIGPEAVAAHAGDCPLSDVSRDGVLDLGGNLAEVELDRLQPYSESCWRAPGVLVDPVCDADVDTYAVRGGHWNNDLASALAALRQTGLNATSTPTIGFRCAYSDQ